MNGTGSLILSEPSESLKLKRAERSAWLTMQDPVDLTRFTNVGLVPVWCIEVGRAGGRPSRLRMPARVIKRFLSVCESYGNVIQPVSELVER